MLTFSLLHVMDVFNFFLLILTLSFSISIEILYKFVLLVTKLFVIQFIIYSTGMVWKPVYPAWGRLYKMPTKRQRWSGKFYIRFKALYRTRTDLCVNDQKNIVGTSVYLFICFEEHLLVYPSLASFSLRHLSSLLTY